MAATRGQAIKRGQADPLPSVEERSARMGREGLQVKKNDITKKKKSMRETDSWGR